MKIESLVTFRFIFRGISSKDESLKKLKTFLHENEWLPEDSEYDFNMIGYHTETNGTCEVILKKASGCSKEELSELFFDDLEKNEEVVSVIVLYNSHTDKLIQNYSGKYLNKQKVDLSNLKELDEVVILNRN